MASTGPRPAGADCRAGFRRRPTSRFTGKERETNDHQEAFVGGFNGR
jgi:hypothetical protein